MVCLTNFFTFWILCRAHRPGRKFLYSTSINFWIFKTNINIVWLLIVNTAKGDPIAIAKNTFKPKPMQRISLKVFLRLKLWRLHEWCYHSLLFFQLTSRVFPLEKTPLSNIATSLEASSKSARNNIQHHEIICITDSHLSTQSHLNRMSEPEIQQDF